MVVTPDSVDGDQVRQALASLGIPNRRVISAHFNLHSVEVTYRKDSADGRPIKLIDGSWATETHRIPITWE